MEEGKLPKLKNPALLKFSKEALAYYIEHSRVFVTEEQTLRSLEIFDQYFRMGNRIRRDQANKSKVK